MKAWRAYQKALPDTQKRNSNKFACAISVNELQGNKNAIKKKSQKMNLSCGASSPWFLKLVSEFWNSTKLFEIACTIF